MHFYTALLEYDGGTYIFQIDASNESAAIDNLCNYIRSDHTFGVNAWRLARAIRARSMPDPIEIKDTQGVWHISTLFARKLVSINLVLTVRGFNGRDMGAN